MLVIRYIANDLFAFAVVSPQVFLTPAFVLRNNSVRRAQNGLRGAVVLLQQNRPRTRVVTLEVLNIATGRTTDRIERRVPVTHPARLRAVLAVVTDPSCD